MTRYIIDAEAIIPCTALRLSAIKRYCRLLRLRRLLAFISLYFGAIDGLSGRGALMPGFNTLR